MRQGIQALENRYATLQQRADQGGFSPARMNKIQNRMGRLENMGATGMRGGQPQTGRGLMAGVRPSQPPTMPQQPMQGQGMAQSLADAFTGSQAQQGIDPGRTMQPQGDPYQNRMSVLDGGKFIQPRPQAPDFRKMAGAFGIQPQIDPTTGQPRRY